MSRPHRREPERRGGRPPVGLGQARAFLAERYGADPGGVALVGEGAWSRCFAFRQGDEELVVRFGAHVDDFHKDRAAHAYAGPGLPIPEVREIGRAFGGHFAVSTRVRGAPLERLDAAGWRAVLPSLAAALEAMRRTEPSALRGVGAWGASGDAPHASWSAYLLSVADDPPGARTHGWRARLAGSPAGEAAFAWGLERLAAVADDAVPLALVHADLLNRNVLVDGGRVSGVFDWGCSLVGDPLYDLAWFEFWSPWHPALDPGPLRAELEARWRGTGSAPERVGRRLRACHLHIGLSHLGYNAWLGDWATLEATAARMRALAGGGAG